MGIICYDSSILNNAFCAPNKIYEYSAFGKPVLGNNIPGLKVLEDMRFGKVVDENNAESIMTAIKDIEKAYSDYSESAGLFYSKCDNKITISKAIETLYHN